jgi:hypothetical protein
MNDLEKTIAEKWQSVKDTQSQPVHFSGSPANIAQQVAAAFALINKKVSK